MNAFLISSLVATLALGSFANVVPSNEQNNFNESSYLETANVTSINQTTTLDMGEALAEMLDAYKKVMPCGNATFGIPKMAPFRQPSLNVNYSGEHVTLKGEIENLVMAGIDDFLIIQLSTNKSSNRTEFDLMYKDIQILGKFNLDAEADIGGIKLTQPFKGFLDLQILNMRVSGGLTIGENEVGGILLSNMDYSVQVGDIVSNGLNTEFSVAVNNFVNQYIRDFSLLFLQTNREFIGVMYSEAATTMANKALYNVPFNAMTSSFGDAIKLLKSMDCRQ